jgi:pimeloyl-ACP methyl ester carboxylesterase/DNA-binding winged helix-turn-helix (wHTH) protein
MTYRFGDCELSEETRELRVAGIARAVEPRVFDLLSLLIARRDHVVSQDELIAALWGGRIVSDSAISACMSAARAAIGDSGARQDWIRTVPRRGFRFVGAVEAIAPAATSRTASPATDRQRVAFCRSADGTRIAYATNGSGPPLVKVGHWLTHLEHDWHSPIWRPFLARLGEHFTITRYDQRGNGLSDWDSREFGLDRFAEDLEAVTAASGVGRCALYATSQGAPIAIAYAHRHPERVSHLVLHGGFMQGRLLRGDEAERAKGEAILTLIRHGWGQRNSAFIEAFSAMFIPDGSREQIDSLADLQRRTTSPENAALLRRAVDLFDVTELLPEVSVPTLVIHARDDGVQPLDQGRELAARIPGAHFVLLESRNHVILPHEGAWPVLFDEMVHFITGD